MRNYSKQREIIYNILKLTKEHPTAEWIYSVARRDLPNISLGTVYRNLLTLEEDGLIVKIVNVNGKDRYDAKTMPHAHVVCKKCGKIMDIDFNPEILEMLGKECLNRGFLEYTIVYKCLCEECKKLANEI